MTAFVFDHGTWPEAGKHILVVGPSGAGMTTMLADVDSALPDRLTVLEDLPETRIDRSPKA